MWADCDRLPEVSASEVVMPYMGLDHKARRTRMRFEPTPAAIDAGRASFDLQLDPGTEHHLYCTVTCESDGEPLPDRMSYEAALRENNAARRTWLGGHCTVVTSNPLVNLWLDRSVSDLSMLTTMLPTGPYPYAGVPWYSTTFGRDGIITALEFLWVDHSLARGVLTFLADTQATEVDRQNDAEPGKILHEIRFGELTHFDERGKFKPGHELRTIKKIAPKKTGTRIRYWADFDIFEVGSWRSRIFAVSLMMNGSGSRKVFL